MYLLSGDVTGKITETTEIYDPVIAFAPIVFWIIVIGIITILGFLLKRRIRNQAKNRQLLQNIEYKLDKLLDVLEKKST
ncbi:hypothetical protein [Gottfriedia acidiceleris]|uniref:DUF4083 domain-containing protein n=1 Tax=Gottfriedia acidiceleris TaxID=371036 RepID=A0ABY4JH03_9BACI|nr:hypothetical protein [Gottfriedia acidiceleris]UPM53098.1 hypothetical protein MY490_14900 [Gottfriedia acidiceleris]